MNIDNVVVLVLLWMGYFAIHSVLASLAIKQWIQKKLPQIFPLYRIGFNLVSTLLLILPVGFMISQQGNPLWQWQGYAKWLAIGLTAAAVITFFWTLHYYDMREFLGIKQSREKPDTIYDQETFKLSPLHRFVRHPWYLLALIIIWCRDMDYLLLTTAIMLTLYFFLGAKWEENKLQVYYGDVYRQYCRLVPGIIPRPWRYLTKEQALQIQSGHNSPNHTQIKSSSGK